MRHLSPVTLTTDEQRLILRITAASVRDHTIFMALGTGLRLAELVGLNVGDVFTPNGTPRARVRIRPEIAKGGRAADVFLPDRLFTKLKRFWSHRRRRSEGLEPGDPLFCTVPPPHFSPPGPVRVETWQKRAGFDRLYPLHSRGTRP